jgi:hypothetical protein
LERINGHHSIRNASNRDKNGVGYRLFSSNICAFIPENNVKYTIFGAGFQG